MNKPHLSKGPWMSRFAIRFFTVVLAVLIFWLLGFMVGDIRSIEGPRYDKIEKQHLSAELVKKRDSLAKQIDDVALKIMNQKETQRLIGDSSRNLQQTINQLLELKKLGIQKNIAFSRKEQDNVTGSLNLFLENQRKYQAMNQTVSDLVRQKHALEQEKKQTEMRIEAQRKPARKEYNRLLEKHRLKLAFFQLAILIPLLAVAAVLIIRKRTHIYFPIFLAFGGAALFKIGLVIHEYFPSRYFKYLLIIALLLTVGRILVHFIRSIAFPKTLWIIRQYREAYERFLCPVCEYPIRTGPRRFLYWTRRTVNRIVVPVERGEKEEPYTCPACGTTLFEACPSCRNVRHALLPNCRHCGAEKTIE